MHVCNRGTAFGEVPQGAKPGIAIVVYDAHGEQHARSDDGFGWFFSHPDCTVWAGGEMSVADVNALGDSFKHWQGENSFWLAAPLLSDAAMDDETIVRAWKWWKDCIDLHPDFQTGSVVLFEFMQEAAMSSSGGRDKTGWPHHGRRHVMQLGLGRKTEGAPENLREMAMKQFVKAATQIAGPGNDTKEWHPGYMHEWNDLREVYGENFDRLKELKGLYDPMNRFNKGVDLAGERVTKNATV